MGSLRLLWTLTVVSAYLERELGPIGLALFVPLLETGVPVLTTLHPVWLQQRQKLTNQFNGEDKGVSFLQSVT